MTNLKHGRQNIFVILFQGSGLNKNDILPDACCPRKPVYLSEAGFSGCAGCLECKIQFCTDPSEAIEYIKEADELVGNNYVFLNLYYKNGTSLMHPYVQGVYINASQMMYLKTASVNK